MKDQRLIHGVLFGALLWGPVTTVSAQSATSVSIAVVEGADPGPFSDARTEDEGFTGTFTIWTRLEANGDMDGVQYRLHVNGGADDGLFRITSYTSGPLSAIDSSFDGLGELFNVGGPPEGFAPNDYSKRTLPVALAQVSDDEIIFNFTQLVAGSSFPGTLIGYVIEPTSALSAGAYVFSAHEAIGTGDSGVWAATPNSGDLANGGTFTLTIAGNGDNGGGGGGGGTDPDPDPEPDPDPVPEPEPEPDPDPTPDPDPDPDPAPDPGPDPGGDPDSDPDSDPDGDPDSGPDPSPDPNPAPATCGAGAAQALTLGVAAALGLISRRRRFGI